MKKTLSVLLIVATVLLVLVSCNSEQKFTEDLVSVSITSSLGKSLSGSTDFDVNNVTTWKYTAKKVNGGLKTGETSTEVALDSNGKTQALSQGIWDFELYGYKTVESEEKRICYGKVSNVTITTSNHTVSIVVAPSQIAQGTIKIADGIKLISSTGETYSGSEYTQTAKVYKGKDATGTEITLTNNEATVDSNSTYYVLVTLTGTAVGDTHKGAVIVNVYDNLTTTVSGTIDEVAQSADITQKAAVITASKEAKVKINTSTGKNTEAVTIPVASTPTGTGKVTTTSEGQTTEVEKQTTVSFPVGALKVATSAQTASSEEQQVSLEITSAAIEEASTTYTITGTDANEVAVVAGFDFNLTGVATTSFDEPVTITTFIQPGLGTDISKLEIKYVGTDVTETEATKPSITSYNNTTGEIVFKVHHFSKYAVVSKSFVATDSDGKLYATFEEALASDAGTIYVLKDVTISKATSLSSSKSIDLKGKTLTINGKVTLPASDSAYKVTFKSGNITGNVSNKNVFNVNTNATLLLEDVKMNVTAYAGIFLYNGANPANLEVKNSTIDVKGGFGIGTNAGDAKATYVSIQIDNSTITVHDTDFDNTGMLINVPATVLINNSTISGERQGLILRGVDTEHEKKIINSTIESTATKTTGYDWTSGTWGVGNRVPLAALVIGDNNTSGYPFGTKVELDNVTLKVGESAVRKGLYVYQDTDKDGNVLPVTVTGTIAGDFTMNGSTNGATVDLGYEANVDGAKFYTTLQDAIDAAGEGAVYIMKDIDLNLTSTVAGVVIGGSYDENDNPVKNDSYTLTIDGNGHKLYNNNKVDSGYRLVNIQCIEKGNIELKNLSLISTKDASDFRGIQVNDVTNSTVKLDNVEVELQDHYALNVHSSCTYTTMKINNSKITGWATINIFAPSFTVTAEDSTFVSYNKYSGNYDDFACIVINYVATNDSMTFSNCKFTVTKGGTANQYLASLRSTCGEFKLTNCEITISDSDSVLDADTTENTITYKNVKLNGETVSDTDN